MEKGKLAILFAIIVIGMVFSLSLGFYLGFSVFMDLEDEKREYLPSEEIEGEANLFIPGVDDQGGGVHGMLTTNIREGSGLVLVNINDVLAGANTQNSARVAARAAREYTNKTLEDKDVIFNIKIDADYIDGPSAGAAMAVSLISLIENRTLKKNVSITGSIDEQGNIGPASQIEQKAESLIEKDVNTLLVSEQVMLDEEIARTRKCTDLNGKEYCEIVYTPEKVYNISGVDTIRVKELNDAMEYFYG